jgi:hypothetical protein
MIPRITQAKLPAAIFCCIIVAPFIRANPEPNATGILQTARVTQMSQDASLTGFLRINSERIPFSLQLADGLIRYRFENPDQEIQLQLAEKEPLLREISSPGSKPMEVNPSDRLRGTAITYEDLSLHFLYWPNPKIIGEDNIRTRSTWKIEVQAPRKRSQYGVARLWIDKASGALMRVEGFDMQGRIAKRFEVISGQKIENQWMLRTMRVEEFEPGTRKVASRTYLEIRE